LGKATSAFFSALSALGGADVRGKTLGVSSASPADPQKQQKPASSQALPNRSLETSGDNRRNFIGRK
jgi:hypothetical protein